MHILYSLICAFIVPIAYAQQPTLVPQVPTNTTVCGPVTVSWSWNGPQVPAIIELTNEVDENKGSIAQPIPPPLLEFVIAVNIDLQLGTFKWNAASVATGWYGFRIYDKKLGATISQLTPSFFVRATNEPGKICPRIVTTGVLLPPTSTAAIPTTALPPPPPPPATSPAPSDVMSGGVIAGMVVGAVVALVIIGACIFFYRRYRGPARGDKAFGKFDGDVPPNNKRHVGRWGGLGSVDNTTRSLAVRSNQSEPSSQFPFSRPETSSSRMGGASPEDDSDGDEKLSRTYSPDYVPPLLSRKPSQGVITASSPAKQGRARAASLKEYVEQQQGHAIGASALGMNGSGTDLSRSLNTPPMPTAVITTPLPFVRTPSTSGGLSQPRRKPAPVYDPSAIELQQATGTASSSYSSTAPLNRSISSLAGLGLASEGDGPVHYLIPDLPPP